MGSIILFFIEKLPQGSKTGIRLFLTTARAVIQILAAAEAQTFAVRLTQHSGIQIQHKDRADHIIQVGRISHKGKYPIIFVLNMDSKMLCSEDCKGLCCGCGTNLNFEDCSCEKEVDPRLAALKQLLNK